MTIRIDGTNTAANPGITGTDTDTGLQFGTDEVNVVTGGSTRATVDSSGRFLVGDTSSAYSNVYLLVAGADNTNYIAMLNTTPSDASHSRYSYLHFRGTQSGGEESSLASIGGMHEGTADDAKGHLRFFTNNGTQNNSLSEAMRLDSSQNLRFNSGYGSVATAFGVRAWVNFNGTGTVSIRGSGNVSSISDLGTGNYNVDYTNSIVDDDYCLSVFSSDGDNGLFVYSGNYATDHCTVGTRTSRTTDKVDASEISVSVIR